MMKKGIVGVYLAAGESRRMGCNKLMLPLGNVPLGSVALQTALHSMLDHLLVAVKKGDPLEWLPSSLLKPHAPKKWDLIYCDDAHLGMSHSLKCAVNAAEQMNAEAIMVLLADQPFVSLQMINELIQFYYTQRPADVWPLYYAFRHQGIPRPPIIFRNTAFSRLLMLEGDEGARRIIRTGPSHEGIFLDSADALCFTDIDTQEEYLAHIPCV
jgi:xanthine dehydrogenase accessory protein pucB